MKKQLLTCIILSIALILGFTMSGYAISIDYLASSTGQTASADFSFTDSTQLKITLTETTPAADSSLVGSGAILTGIGFLLPDNAVIVLPGGVTIATGSASVGFRPQRQPPEDLGAGADVSGEWGATVGGEKPMDGVGNWDFVSTITAQVTKFAGANLDGPSQLSGPQGGLLLDSAARGGLGVIENSVIILLTLDADPSVDGNQDLTDNQQTAFLDSLSTKSLVEYGSDEAFGYPIPEPATMLLVGSVLIGLSGLRWSLRKK
jgi:hypothetical protein